MSENKLEALSAFMDGEHNQPAGGLIQAMAENDDLKGAWHRYHLIRDCLRSCLPQRVDIGVAARVRVALQGEPALLSRPAPPATLRVLKPVAGMAIAATVAVAVIVGLKSNGPEPAAGGGQQLAQQTVEPPASPAVADTGQARALPASAAASEPATSQLAAQNRLNRYLVNYNEYRANAGIGGTLPYVRIVAFDADQ
jgi:sigma-E factor negative regulatory protein RseA